MSRTSFVRPFLESLEERVVLASSFTVDFQVTSDWGSGFGSNVVLTNTGPDALAGWRLEFDFDRNIDTIWNADVAQHQGTHYTLVNKSYNASVPVGGKVYFGFNGSPGNVKTPPANYRLNGVPMGTTPPSLPSLAVNDVRVTEGAAAGFTV